MFHDEKQRREWLLEVPSAEMKLVSLTESLVLSIASLESLEVHMHVHMDWFCLILTSRLRIAPLVRDAKENLEKKMAALTLGGEKHSS